MAEIAFGLREIESQKPRKGWKRDDTKQVTANQDMTINQLKYKLSDFMNRVSMAKKIYDGDFDHMREEDNNLFIQNLNEEALKERMKILDSLNSEYPTPSSTWNEFVNKISHSSGKN